MQGDDQMRPIEPGYLTQDITKVPGWHGLVAWDLLFNNLTTGLFLELRETLSRIYRDQQVHLAVVLSVVGGTLIPLILLLVGDGVPWILGALLFILAGNLAIRSLFLKIPHASHESRSGGKA